MPLVAPPVAVLPPSADFSHGYPAGTVLGEWPIDLGDLQLDRVDEHGGQWNVTAFTGRGSPPSAIETSQRTAGHGAWVGGRWWGAKPYALDVAYEGETPRDRFDAQQRLLSAAGLDDTVMVMHEEVPWWASVVLNGEVAIDPVNTYAFTAQVPLLAPDPFRYSLEPYADFTYLPQQSGGLSWPASWPAVWDASASTGLMSVYNTGSEISYPMFRVYGPLPDFTLSQPETGEQLAVDPAADGEALAAGEWVEIDMKRQRVMLLGQSSRRRWVRGDFFGLPPGAASVLFGSSTYNATAFVDITGYSTWR